MGRSTTVKKKKKGDSSSSPLPLRRSTRSSNPHPLPLPLEEEKKKGPGPNARRKARHEDVLRRLQRIIIRDKDHQTQERGLFRIPYKHTYPRFCGKMDLREFVRKEKKDVKTGVFKGMTVGDDEIRKFLGQVLRERPYVAFSSYGMRKKVVLGNLYINQGDLDFVYLNLREQSNLFGSKVLVAAATESGVKEENYFSLEDSENGDIWISIDDGVERVLHSSSSTLVSVNGDALDNDNGASSSSLGGGKRKLEFGDIITISTNKGEQEEEWERTDFLFMMPSQGKVINPLDNPLILASVLSFLPTNEIKKKARRVSVLWNEEALNALRKRTDEVAIRVIDQVDIRSGDGFRSMTLFNPLPEPFLKYPNWKLALPGGASDKDTQRQQNSIDFFHFRSKKEKGLVTGFVECLEAQRIRINDQKIMDDLKELFCSSQKHVQSLHLTVGTEREAHLRMMEVMLGGVNNTLKALTLKLTFQLWNGESIPLSPSSSSLVELPCLSHLSLDFYSGYGHLSSQRSVEIKRFLASFLLPAVGNIQSLSILNGYDSSYSSKTIALEEIAKMQDQDQQEPSTKFGRLSQIKILESSDEGRNNSALKALSSLRKNSLRMLELGEIDSGDTALLWHVLERFSESLQELKVEFFGNPTLCIQFPTRMRNLTALSVFLRWDQYERDPSSTHVHFRTPGQPDPKEEDEDDHQRMNDEIDYALHFPSLVKLAVAPVDRDHDLEERNFEINEEVGWWIFLPFLSAFLPTQRRVPSIRTLDIPFLLKGKYHPVLDNLEAIFPSVVFPLEQGLALAQARGGPIWTQEDDDEDRRAREADD